MDHKKELTEEGKRKYSEIKIQRIFHLDSQRTQLVLLRYQALATVSGIATAFAGFILTTASSCNTYIATLAILVLAVAMLLGIWLYLYNGKKYIGYLSNKIEEVPNLDIGEQSKLKEPNLSNKWPEIILLLLTVGVFLLLISFI